MNINIDTPHATTLEVPPDRVIEFPRGLVGFENLRRFSLHHPETEGDAMPRYFILQAIDDPDVAFHIADPELFGFSYEITLSDEETAALELSDPSEAAVVVMLVKEGDGEGQVRANLKAPLVINLNKRRGLQHVFARLSYQVTLRALE